MHVSAMPIQEVPQWTFRQRTLAPSAVQPTKVPPGDIQFAVLILNSWCIITGPQWCTVGAVKTTAGKNRLVRRCPHT